MIKRLDLDNRDDRLTLDVFKSMFGLRTIQLGRKAYCWRLTFERLLHHYGEPTQFLRGLWNETASSADGQNPQCQA